MDLGDCPPLQRGDYFYIRAFWELHSDRRFQGAPIPWSSIMEFSDRQGFDHDLTEAFHVVIRELDEEYGAWRRNK